MVIQGDTDLVSSNIISGKEIFGINGSAQGNSGTYAWVKKERQATITPVNITITATCSNLTLFKNISISADSMIDLLETNDFIGLTLYTSTSQGFDYLCSFSDNGICNFEIIYSPGDTQQAGSDNWYYDATNKMIVLSSGMEYETGFLSTSWSGTKTVTKNKETGVTEVTIGYVVSDNSSAYPNNATHTDGYYYTKVS